MYLVYLKYWTLSLMPLMVYPKVLFHPNFSIKGLQGHTSSVEDIQRSPLHYPCQYSPCCNHR